MPSESTTKEQLLNGIPLSIFVSQILGDYDHEGQLDGIIRNHDYVEVHPVIAEILFAHCRNKHTVYIQFPGSEHELNILGKPISVPLVWRWSKFVASTELWLAQRKRAEDERKEYFVREYNIKQAMRTFMSYTGIDEKFALPLAQKVVMKDQETKIIKMGGKPFVRKWEDLP